MKHGVDGSLTADILIQNYPNTMNARWHEVRSVNVIEKPQNDLSDSEICKIWTQNHRPIAVILWFAVLPISPFKITKSINVVTLCVNRDVYTSLVLSIRFVLVHDIIKHP